MLHLANSFNTDRPGAPRHWHVKRMRQVLMKLIMNHILFALSVTIAWSKINDALVANTVGSFQQALLCYFLSEILRLCQEFVAQQRLAFAIATDHKQISAQASTTPGQVEMANEVVSIFQVFISRLVESNQLEMEAK